MKTDVIRLQDRLIYRKHKEHEYVGLELISTFDAPEVNPEQPVRVENIAGRFHCTLYTSDIGAVTFNVCNRKRKYKQIYHFESTLNIKEDVVFFKGGRGIRSLQQVADSIGLENSNCSVYMVLVTASLGRFVDVNFGCFIERHFQGVLRARARIIDLHPVVYLDLKEWNDNLPFSKEYEPPVSMLITVSSKGTVIMRCVWKQTVWTVEAEENLKIFCQWVVTQIKNCT